MAKAKLTFWETHRKRVGSNGRFVNDLGHVFEDVEVTFPTLIQFLSGGKIGEEDIEGGSVLIFCSQDGPSALVRDRHHGKCAFVKKRLWSELWNAVEAGLEKGTLDWRKDKFAQTGRKSPAK